MIRAPSAVIRASLLLLLLMAARIPCAMGQSTDAQARAAVMDLGGCNHDLAVPPLLRALSDDSQGVRKAARAALARQSTEKGLALLVKPLQRSKRTAERAAILEAFKVTRPDKAYEIVLKLTAKQTSLLAAGEQRRSRRRADRLRHIEAGEPHSLGRHAVQVRRAEPVRFGSLMAPIV